MTAMTAIAASTRTKPVHLRVTATAHRLITGRLEPAVRFLRSSVLDKIRLFEQVLDVKIVRTGSGLLLGLHLGLPSHHDEEVPEFFWRRCRLFIRLVDDTDAHESLVITEVLLDHGLCAFENTHGLFFSTIRIR